MPFKCYRTRLLCLAAFATFVVLATPFSPAASAHAPIEWAEPKADSVVAEMPDTVKVRFAEEPVSVTMRTIEPEPRKGLPLAPIRISERTYEVALSASMIAPTDNSIVIFIETLSTDGHTESGVYLLHVVDQTTSSTSSSSSVVPVVTGPVVTTPTAVFMPPVDTGSSARPLWLVVAVLAASSGALVVVLHRARKRN